MAAITSNAVTGNWSAGASWVGGVAPEDGDTATIVNGAVITVSANQIVGSSPASGGTAAVTINSGGKLKIAQGIKLTARGNVVTSASNTVRSLELVDGSWLFFDVESAAAPASTVYELQTTAQYSGSQPGIYIRGIAANPAKISASRAGAAFIDDTGGGYSGLLDAEFCEFTSLGSNATAALTFWPSSDGSDLLSSLFRLISCIFDGCGDVVSGSNFGAYSKVTIQNCTFKNGTGTYDLWIQCYGDKAGSASVRLIDGNVFNKSPRLYAPRDLIVANNIFCKGYDTSTTDAEGWAGFENNLIVVDDTVSTIKVNGAQFKDNFILYDDAVATNPHFMQVGNYEEIGASVIDGTWFEFTGTDYQGDCIAIIAAVAAYDITVQNCGVLPNADGNTSGTLLSALGSANTTLTIERNTAFLGSGGGVAVGETYAGHAGMVNSFKNNLFWDTSARAYKLYDSGGNNSVSDLVASADANYNGGYNFLAGSNLKGYNNLEFSSGSPGANDVEGNPTFVDSARDFAKFGGSLGGTATVAAVLTEFKKKNDRSGFNTGYTPIALVNYIRTGFAPTNVAFDISGSDGSYIGAVDVNTGTVVDDDDPPPPPPPPVVGTPPGSYSSTVTKFATFNANRQRFLRDLLPQQLDPYSPSDPSQVGLFHVYYDVWACGYFSKKLTGDATYQTVMDFAFDIYYTQYIAPNIAIPQYWIFTDGWAQRYEDDGAAADAALVIEIAGKGNYADGSASDELDMATTIYSRENAYALENYVNVMRVGGTKHAKFNNRLQDCYDHIDQWVGGSATYYRPFMGALTLKALAWVWLYAKTQIPDTTIFKAKYKALLDYTWLFWNETGAAFQYTNISTASSTGFTGFGVDSGGTELAPDLNLLISPCYAFYWKITGDATFITKHDKIFNGGVSVYNGNTHTSGAWFGNPANVASINGKHIGQNYIWADRGIEWRTTNWEGATVDTDPDDDDDDTDPPPPPPPPSGYSQPPAGSPLPIVQSPNLPTRPAGSIFTCLSIANAVFSRIRLPRITRLVGSSDKNARALLEAFYQEGEELKHRYTWPQLTKEYRFTLRAGVASYPLPKDFSCFVFDTEWDVTGQNYLYGPVEGPEWQLDKTWLLSSAGIYKKFRVMGSSANQLHIYPTPSSSDEAKLCGFEYQSMNWMLPAPWLPSTTAHSGSFISNGGNTYYTVDGGTTGSIAPTHTVDDQGVARSLTDGAVTWLYWAYPYVEFYADTDVPLFDHELLKLGVEWRFREGATLPYDAVRGRYEAFFERVRGNLRGAQVLSWLHSGVSLLTPNIPEGSWDI